MSMFMSLIADTQLKRMISLLKYLAGFQNFVTAEQIARKLNISRKTVLTDIKTLNQKMPEGIEIVKKKGIGVKLEWQEQMSIETYMLLLVQNTIEFKILDGVYKGDIYNINELEHKLFASDFAIRKCIKHINSIIKNYKCALSTYSVDIEGKEINIRFFFYSFYRGMRDLFINMQQQEKELSESFEVFIESTRKLNLPMLHLDYQQAIYWLEVIRTRLAKKNYIKLKPNFVKSIANRHTYQLFAPALARTFFSKFNIEDIPEDELVSAYVGGLNCIIYSIDRAAEFDVVTLTDEEDPNVLRKINAFLLNNLSKFEIDIVKNSEAYLVHQAFLVNIRLLSQLSPLFQKKTLLLKNYVIEHHERAYQKWLSILKWTKAQDLFPIYYIEDISITLTLLTVAAIFDQKGKCDCHVLFSFHGEAGYPNYLAAISRSMLPDNVRCTYVNNQQIDDAFIRKLGANLLVSNYDHETEIEDCELVHFSYIPTTREWTYLQNLVIEKTSR